MKIVNQIPLGDYTVIEVSEGNYFGNFASIDDKEIETELTYDLPNCIALKAKGDFVGKDVTFHD